GAVMYEMATGRRPFESSSPAGVIAAILQVEPPAPSTLQPDLPPSIDWVIQKSLAKNRHARWRAAGDLVEVLRWIARAPEPAAATVAPPRRLRPILVVSLLVVAAALLALAPRLHGPAAAPASLAFSIFPPERGGFTPTPSSVPTPQFALSPNGRRLVFVASVAYDAPQLWIRELDALNAEPVPGTHGAEYPFWSPDSESIGFFANGSLKRVAASGGPATVLTQLDASRHQASHRWPQFLSDDRHFIYFVQSTSPETHG